MIEITAHRSTTRPSRNASGPRWRGPSARFWARSARSPAIAARSRLAYEAYPEMALKKLAELEDEARRRWPVIELALVHRVGDLDLGEVSVVVAVSCPHRQQAFEACRWLIDTLKEVVPIWKKEIWADGNEEWVHPGLAPELRPRSARIRYATADVRL